MRTIKIYIPLLLLTVFILFPFWWMFVISVSSDRDTYDITKSPFVIREFTLKHYHDIFTMMPLSVWLKNSFFVTTVSTALALLISMPAAYSLARMRFRGSSTVGAGIFITYLIPPTLLFLPLAAVVRTLGLANSIWALVVTYPTFLVPFCTWFLIGYFHNIPKDIEDCSLVDGCTRLQTLIRIVLPLSMPGVIAAAIFSFTAGWNEYIYALTMVQRELGKTAPVGIVSYLSTGDAFFWGKIFAAATVAAVPVAVVYSFISRYFVEGLTAGSIKG